MWDNFVEPKKKLKFGVYEPGKYEMQFWTHNMPSKNVKVLLDSLKDKEAEYRKIERPEDRKMLLVRQRS